VNSIFEDRNSSKDAKVLENVEKILLHLAPLRIPDLKTEAKNHTESLLYLNELSENVAKESDAEMKELLREEIRETEELIGEIEEEVFDDLAEYETEEAEKANFVVEAGAGGDEAGIFARNGSYFEPFFRCFVSIGGIFRHFGHYEIFRDM
jgi:protein subunit release factor A